MLHTLIAKLRQAGPLASEDEDAVRAAFSRTAPVRRNEDVIAEGEPSDIVMTLLEGMTCRYRLLADGRRQITALVLPGDICDLSALLFGRVDYGVAAVTDGRIAIANRQAVLDLVAARPNIARALWWSTMGDEAVLREWVVGLGRRSAHQRIAHFFCELLARYQAIGLARDNTCPLPLTQEGLGDLAGLTVVHVNRVIQDFRAEGLIDLSHKVLAIRDWNRLRALGGFSDAYLHRNAAAVGDGELV